jgi:hypothetical protein
LALLWVSTWALLVALVSLLWSLQGSRVIYIWCPGGVLLGLCCSVDILVCAGARMSANHVHQPCLGAGNAGQFFNRLFRVPGVLCLRRFSWNLINFPGSLIMFLGILGLCVRDDVLGWEGRCAGPKLSDLWCSAMVCRLFPLLHYCFLLLSLFLLMSGAHLFRQDVTVQKNLMASWGINRGGSFLRGWMRAQRKARMPAV